MDCSTDIDITQFLCKRAKTMKELRDVLDSTIRSDLSKVLRIFREEAAGVGRNEAEHSGTQRSFCAHTSNEQSHRSLGLETARIAYGSSYMQRVPE